ncbi:MAG: hypothetical protein IKB07_08215 [Lachnospiraceae bacterium]|nr:hypothetical protein [Lachnospiraceae bacterium]
MARKERQRLLQRAAAEMDMLKKNKMAREAQSMQPKKIGSDEVLRASDILKKYKAGKARLEQKIIANEEFWKLRQWRYIDEENAEKEFQPATAWLWSCIQSRYSDVMDSYPTCNIKPRQRDDKGEAAKLSAIIPVIMEQNRYEETYSDHAWYMLKQGGGVHGVFWDGSKHNGLGDISIKKIDFINLFWEPGITNIQDSTHLFHTELVNNDLLEQRYPQCVGKLGGNGITLAKYLYDENIDTSEKSVVIDWYYHTEYNGKRVLQFVKYVNDIVLYATENETEVPLRKTMDPDTGIEIEVPTGQPSVAERGLYDHAKYPFVVQPLYPVEGSLCGYGLTDIGRDTQIQIDEMNKAIMENGKAGATPRYFSKGDGSIKEEEFADYSKKIVHVTGSIDETNIRPIDNCQLPQIYVELYNNKIEELKYITSNQDSNNGVAPSGVTAASAIAALQETAGKNARSSNKAFHRAYREVVYLVVELIRQFYDVPRTFRIAPDVNGQEQYIEYSNVGIKPQKMQTMGYETGYRLPEFDIEVTSEKANPYKKMEMNELALNFYSQGFFNPQMADQALACLQMMDFNHKEEIIQRIQQNVTLQQQVLMWQQLALQYAQAYSPREGMRVGQTILSQSGQPLPQGGDVNISGGMAEHPYVERSREQARASTQAE